VNQLALSATALEVQPLRYTPAGLPAIEMLLGHESEVIEAGKQRRIELTLGASLTIQGFLAPVRKGSTKLVLHIQKADRVYAGGGSVVV
jgi:primosomal replication protein N